MSYLEIVKGISYLVIKGNLEQEFLGKIRIDSRMIKTGDMFVALCGLKVDGHDFIEAAINLGAKCIVTEKEVDVPGDIVVIKVDDTHKCLLELAAVIRKHYINIPLIAVTGSVGKTTTKELIYQLLSTKYHVLKSQGNYNNAIGVPLTLFELDNTYDMCVLELGMNHFGEINQLSRLCIPTDAVITVIGTSHIGFLGSKKNIFKAKMEIVNGLGNGNLIVNGDDYYLNRIKPDGFRLFKCGEKNNNDIQAIDILSTDKKLYLKIKVLGDSYKVVFPVPNEGLIIDILLAVTVALKYQVSIYDAVAVLENYNGIECRNQIIKLKHNITLIDDSYNASFESLKAGLKMLENFTNEKIIIIGDILELGNFSIKIHKKIKRILKNYTKVILVGTHVKNIIGKDYVYCSNADDVIKYLETLDLANKVIYLKASHSIGLDKVSNEIQAKFI